MTPIESCGYAGAFECAAFQCLPENSPTSPADTWNWKADCLIHKDTDERHEGEFVKRRRPRGTDGGTVMVGG